MKDSKSQKSKEESTKKNTWIAGKKTIQDWEKLKDKVDPEKDDYWDKAFKFFEIRIKTRYLKPIKRIQCMNRNVGEGFAMVNLQCSLIETIESFYNGWVYHLKKDKHDKNETGFYFREIGGNPFFRENWKIFKSFFEKRIKLNSEYKEELKKNFYSNIRCGLLHETQTKGGWIIRSENNNSDSFFEVYNDAKILFRNDLQNALNEIIEQFKKEITTGDGLEKDEKEKLRKNFIAKFTHICEIS